MQLKVTLQKIFQPKYQSIEKLLKAAEIVNEG